MHIFTLIVVLSLSCQKKEETGKGLGQPATADAFESIIAAGLLTDDSSLDDDETVLADFITQFFTGDSVTIIKSLFEDIDTKMTNLSGDARNEADGVSCVDDPTLVSKSFDDDIVPADNNLSHKLHCTKDFEGDAGTGFTAFGKIDETTWHFRTANRTSGIGQTVIATTDKSIEALFYIYKDSSSPIMLMQLEADVQNEELEFTVAGENIAIGCGFHLKSNSDFVYISGILDDPSDTASCGSAEERCLRASTLTNRAISTCEDEELDDFNLTTLTAAGLTLPAIESLVDEKVTGVATF